MQPFSATSGRAGIASRPAFFQQDDAHRRCLPRYRARCDFALGAGCGRLGPQPGRQAPRPRVAHAGRPLVIPSLSHVQAFLAFLGAHGHGRILIHCAAGLGRSPALAIIAMVSQGIDALSTCALVWEAVPHASLNRMRMTQAAPTEVRHEVGNWAVPPRLRTPLQRRRQGGPKAISTGRIAAAVRLDGTIDATWIDTLWETNTGPS